ncbi:MAG: glycosyl hydrolase family 28-related protein [Pirellula sp.]|jgi:hypothetical protein
MDNHCIRFYKATIAVSALFVSLTVCDLCWALETQYGARLDLESDVKYPLTPMIIDVTKPPYNATGDGIQDDTAAIQRALTDMMGTHKMLYFPNGIYLVSRTLQWSKKNSAGRDAWGKNFLCGQNGNKTVIRLKEGTFTDPQKPASIMWCGGFGSADWFHNYVENVTFDVGDNNAGAIGLQFYSNNSGAVRNCRFLAGQESGLIGLDLGHRDMNGPLLVRNCEVIGFDRGISTSRAVNGQTFEYITLRDQRQFGFDNEGQAISVRGLLSENNVPVVRSYGVFCLVDAQLKGKREASNWPAIINYNGGRIFLRDVTTSRYKRAVGDVETPDWFASVRVQGDDKPGSLGPSISEYSSHSYTRAFPGVELSLKLPVKDPPAVVTDPPNAWVNVDDFGADPTGNKDSADAIRKAMNSGASTIFMPGLYAMHSTVTLGPKVKHVVGIGGMVDYFGKAKPDFRILDGESPTVTFEHFAYIHGGIEIDTSRTIIFRSVSDCDLTFGANAEGGELFFEDFVTHNLVLENQKVWARQLNVENEGTHVLNKSSDLWVLGYKTERGGTLLETKAGGHSEVLGGFSYTTTAGKLAPMFVTKDASLFTFFHEVCFNGDPFAMLVEESQAGESKKLPKGRAHTAPYRAQ